MTITPLDWPRWALMWTMAAAIYIGCKWLTWRKATVRCVPAWRQAAYLLAWPGLDATSFLERRPIAACQPIEWIPAAAKLACGAALFFGVARVIPPEDPYLVGWIGMIGLVLMLHFGAFHLLSCGWRHAGLDARPLMNRPLLSASVSEFWGRRWNTAFRDFTHRFLFQPCARWFGARWGIVAGFLFSGVIHDVVISVPARGGYGGPTLFFAVQGLGMVVERSRVGRRMGLDSGWPGRLFAYTLLIAPVGLLFHRPFVVGVVVPFMRALGGIR